MGSLGLRETWGPHPDWPQGSPSGRKPRPQAPECGPWKSPTCWPLPRDLCRTQPGAGAGEGALSLVYVAQTRQVGTFED